MDKNILRPRLCQLIKPQPEVEFGFNLHAEKNNGHFIGKVDRDSVAEKAGLEEGQRIVGVNGILVYPTTPNRDVVQIIKSDPARTELLVATAEVDQWYRKNGKEYNFQDAEIFEPIVGKMAQFPLSKAPPVAAAVENGVTNGGVAHKPDVAAVEESSVMQDVVAKPLEAIRNISKPVEEAKKESTLPRPPPPEKVATVERSTSENFRSPSLDRNGGLSAHHHQDWMNLSAAELRERVTRHKKSDPRKQNLSLLQKYEIIHNL